MNQFQVAIAVMAFCDIGGGPRDAEGRLRQYTPEELDAIAAFGWNRPTLKGFFAALVPAVRLPWKLSASSRLDPKPLSPAETPLPG
jgi:hypothetical protein